MWKVGFLFIIVAFASTFGENITLACSFQDYGDAKRYTCILQRITVLDPSVNVTFNATHDGNRTDADVEAVLILDSNTPFIIHQLFTTFPNLRYLYIDDSNLATIVIPPDAQLLALIILGNNVTKITSNWFRNQTQLRLFAIINSGVTDIDEDAFEDMYAVEHFSLRNNKIEKLSPRTLAPLINALDINLDNNSLSIIDEDIFSQNTKLEELYLQNNQINQIHPRAFDNLRNSLYTLYLTGNQCASDNFSLRSDHDGIAMNNSLKACFRRNITLTCLFEDYADARRHTCSLQNITVLDPSVNVTFNGTHDGNRTDADVETVLIYDSNTPFIIHQLFTTFPNLRYLYIHGSNLATTVIPPDAQLLHLYILGNNVTKITSNWFRNQTQLRLFAIINGGVTDIDEDAFEDMYAVEHFSLRNNKIEKLSPRTLAPLINALDINLDNNSLSIIDEDIFLQNTNLEELYLQNNRINQIHPRAFDNLRNSLNWLNLTGNQCVSDNFSLRSDHDWIAMNNSLKACFRRNITLTCSFQDYGDAKRYTCILQNITVYPSVNVTFNATHDGNRTYADVEAVLIFDSNTPFIIHQLFTTFPNLRYLYIDDSNLATIVIPPDAQLLELIILGNNVTKITSNWFRNQTQLRLFAIINSGVTDIDEDAFEDMYAVEHFSLRNNKIEKLSPRTLAPLINALDIYLDNNSLSIIDEDIFSQNTKLEELYLQNNQINQIHPRAFDNLRNSLNWLNLTGNQCVSDNFSLRSDHDWIAMNNSLKACFRRNITLTCLFEDYADARRYTCILQHITVLDPSVNVTFNGTHDGNRTDADVEAVLIYDSNTPYIIHQLFTTFPNLRYLSIYLSNLETIVIPPDAQLLELSILGNNVTKITSNSFRNQTQLNYIHISSSGVTDIDEDAFEYMHGVKYFSLKNNTIEKFAPRTLAPLINAMHISLDNNSLSIIDEDIFSQNTKLRVLNLQNNQIYKIHPRAFDNLRNSLNTLFLNGNWCVSKTFFLLNDQDWATMNNSLEACFRKITRSDSLPY